MILLQQCHTTIGSGPVSANAANPALRFEILCENLILSINVVVKSRAHLTEQ
jgi:hypothetical protein